MPNQTPVQIAWVTRDLGATETALTQLLGAKKWVRMSDVHFGPDTCTHRGQPADYVAHVSLSYARGTPNSNSSNPSGAESIYTEFLDASGPGLITSRSRPTTTTTSTRCWSTPNATARRWCAAAPCPAG